MEFKRSIIIAIAFSGTVVFWPGLGHSQARDLITELGGAPAGTTGSNAGVGASGRAQSLGGFTGSATSGLGTSGLGPQSSSNSAANTLGSPSSTLFNGGFQSFTPPTPNTNGFGTFNGDVSNFTLVTIPLAQRSQELLVALERAVPR